MTPTLDIAMPAARAANGAAIDRALGEGYRTADIAAGGDAISTSAMGELIARYAAGHTASQPASQGN